MTKTLIWKFSLSFFIAVAFVGCSDNDEPKRASVERTLTNSELVSSRAQNDLRVFIQLAQISVPLNQLLYDVDIYQVEYDTEFKGQTITASGLVLIPQTEDEVGMISYQHGTIAGNAQAPSQLLSTSSELILYGALASFGMVVVVPDFIGFGSSVDIMHPYYVEDVTASAIFDNVLAGRNLAEDLEVNINDKLYLAGYSQGGYATMVAHKYIEENDVEGFDLIASFPAAGGYDIKGVQEFFFEQETYSQPFYLAYVAEAYRQTFDWEQPLSLLFNEPYATNIPSYFDGSLSGSQINAQLTETVADLVDADYLADPDGETYSFINDAFQDNTPIWIPTNPVFMYHGDADVTVPYQNSVDYLEHLINDVGVSNQIVTLTTLEGGTHSTGVAPYIEEMVTELIRLEER
ncbi:MAG: alpha/beta fold hydrolase [Cyclobacteriaceae bacterium]|nr:alpha/beta fold hydrolase [Cyclobacteriaceae bacterium HetDA_MAG_MS6]